MMDSQNVSSGYSKIGIAFLVLALSLAGLGAYNINKYISDRQAAIRAQQEMKEKAMSRQTGRIASSSILTRENIPRTRPPGDNTQYPKEFIQPGTPSNTVTNTDADTTPTIRITAPNGGEKLRIGDIATISWSTKNTPEDAWVRIGYVLPAAVTGKSGGVWLECIEDVPADSGIYDWNVPESYSECGGAEQFFSPDITFASQVAIELFPSEPQCQGNVPEGAACLQGSTHVIASDVSDSYFTMTNTQ